MVLACIWKVYFWPGTRPLMVPWDSLQGGVLKVKTVLVGVMMVEIVVMPDMILMLKSFYIL